MSDDSHDIEFPTLGKNAGEPPGGHGDAPDTEVTETHDDYAWLAAAFAAVEEDVEPLDRSEPENGAGPDATEDVSPAAAPSDETADHGDDLPVLDLPDLSAPPAVPVELEEAEPLAPPTEPPPLADPPMEATENGRHVEDLDLAELGLAFEPDEPPDSSEPAPVAPAATPPPDPAPAPPPPSPRSLDALRSRPGFREELLAAFSQLYDRSGTKRPSG